MKTPSAEQMIKELLEEKRGRFSIVHAGSTTYSNKETIEEVVREFYSCWNSVMIMAYDHKNKKFYYGAKNKTPDVRGNYNRSWHDLDTKEMVFNEDAMTKPLDKVQPVPITKELRNGFISPNGKFYECGHECHRFLAKELFWTNTVTPTAKETEWEAEFEADKYLEKRGWIKITDNRRITHVPTAKVERGIPMTAKQIKALTLYLEVHDRAAYEFQYTSNVPVETILKQIHNE